MPTRNLWRHGRVGTLVNIVLQLLRLERFAERLALGGVDDEEVLADTRTARLVADQAPPAVKHGHAEGEGGGEEAGELWEES